MLRKLLLLIYGAVFITTAQAVPITGKVVGPDDKPVAGAEIVVMRAYYDTDHPIVAKTNQAGVFAVDVEPIGAGTANFGVATAYAPPLAFGSTLLKQGENVIKLERAVSVQGMVQDKAGQPVADAIINLQYAKSLHFQPGISDYSDYTSVPPSLVSKFSVKTGADGRWSLTGIPASKVALVLLDDPRFARTDAQARPGEEAATALITALPGANLTGRVVHEDGTPASGITVSTYGLGSGVQTTTATDGTYTLTSLVAGIVAVTAYDPTGKLVTPALYGVQTKAGETVKVADRVLTEGALIEGKVTDQADGTPLPGIPVIVYRAEPGQAQIPVSGGSHPLNTDKDGHFKLRAPPGKISFGGWESLSKYLSLPKQVEIEALKGETKTVSIQLVKGLSVSGMATSADGKPVAAEFSASPNQAFSLDYEYTPTVAAQVDKDGKWTLDGMKPGQWNLKGTGDWEVVSPKQIVVPLATAVQVIVRPLQWQTLKGRVTTKDHQPVVGARINALVEIFENGYFWQHDTQEATTDAQGQFVIERVQPDAKVSISSLMPGYKYVAGGKVTKQETGFIAQDLVLTPLTAKLEGRVVDTLGQPVAGAQVMSPDGALKAPTLTDAAGKFVLTGLPEGEVMVVAGLKNSIGEAREVNEQRPLNLTLTPIKAPPSHATQRAYEILDDLWATTEGEKYHRNNIPSPLAPFAPDLALKLATKPDGSVDDSILSHVIIDYARADPDHAAQWAPPHLNQIQNGEVANVTKMDLALALAKVKPELAKDLYEQAKTYHMAQMAKAAPDPPTTIGRATILAILARKLGIENEAKQWVQAALAVDKATQDHAWTIVLLADLDYDETAKMIDALPVSQRPEMLSIAVSQSVDHDVPLAQRWMAKLLEAEKNSSDDGVFASGAAQSLIKALGPTDPAAALALARAAPNYKKPLGLAIAAQFQTKEVALQALHEAADFVVGQQSGTLDTISRLAAQAYELDPKFGLELFAAARERAASVQARNKNLDTYGYNENVAAFAFYYSRVDPATSRLMLEAEFARDLQQPPSDENTTFEVSRELWYAAEAMAAIDVERALELSLLIPPPDPRHSFSAQSEAQRGIAQYLLLSEADRRTRPFREWTVVREAY